jgi:hypothetical protein
MTGHEGVGHLDQSLEARGRLVALDLGHDRGDIQVGLAAELAGNQGGVDDGPVADVPDGRALEAALAEQLPGGQHQRQLGGGRVSRPAGSRPFLAGAESRVLMSGVPHVLLRPVHRPA